MVSGAQKTIKDLQQMAMADAEAIIDSIEGLMNEASHGAGDAATARLAEPVLSKTGHPSIQGDSHSATSRMSPQECALRIG